MGRTLAHLPWVLAWGTLAPACAPEWGDEVTVVADAGATVDAPTTAPDRPAARDVATFDSPAPPDVPRFEVYIVDVIAGHCGPTPGTTWIDQTGVGGVDARWTLAVRTDL